MGPTLGNDGIIIIWFYDFGTSNKIQLKLLWKCILQDQTVGIQNVNLNWRKFESRRTNLKQHAIIRIAPLLSLLECYPRPSSRQTFEDVSKGIRIGRAGM